MATSNKQKQANERRQTPREPYVTAVDYTIQGHTYSDFIQNIGADGVYIETRQPLSIGDSIALSFPLPGYQSYITVTGIIVRVTPDGIGVKFNKAIRDLLKQEK
jgi:Tfp pilus assembly protein PilZ